MDAESPKGPSPGGRWRLDLFFPSNALAGMRAFVSKNPALSPLLQELIPVLLLVLDANEVQQELRWRLKKRRNPNAKTYLQEVMESGLVVAVAPTFLKSEIEEHLLDIAADCRIPIAQAREEWEGFQAQLHFYEPRRTSEPASQVVDPDDLPYKYTYEELGAIAVYSGDRHLPAMQVPVVADPLDSTLRSHARAASVVIGTQLGSGFTLILGIETVSAACRLIKHLVDQFVRLPAWVQIVIALVAAGILAHPKSRAKIGDLWQSLRSSANAAKLPIFGTLAEVAEQAVDASATARQTYKEIQSALPSPRKQSAIMCARAICLLSKQPLAVGEIERQMRNQGYSTRSKNFASYLRRVLRASGQFTEVSPGLWTLQSAQA